MQEQKAKNLPDACEHCGRAYEEEAEGETEKLSEDGRDEEASKPLRVPFGELLRRSYR